MNTDVNMWQFADLSRRRDELMASDDRHGFTDQRDRLGVERDLVHAFVWCQFCDGGLNVLLERVFRLQDPTGVVDRAAGRGRWHPDRGDPFVQQTMC